MCVIIDTCTFAAVFDTSSKNHAKYVPILDWLQKKHGKIITGGTKYMKEMMHCPGRTILKEYERSGRLAKMNDAEVDRIAKALKEKITDPDFDDEHLVALVSVSRCKVVCTNDKRAFPYLKRSDLYPKNVKRPKIYQNAKNAILCCQGNVVDACR